MVFDSTNAPQLIQHSEQSLNFTPFDTKWIPSAPKFVLLGSKANGRGAFQIYELEHGGLKMCDEMSSADLAPVGFKCGTFGASAYEQRHLATGNEKGQLQIWDLDQIGKKPIFDVKAHDQIINAIDGIGGQIGGGAPEIVTGSRDGCVKVWDPRQQDPVASLEPAQGEAARDCWTVSFGNSHDQERCVVAGYDNGDVKMLDLRMNKLIWETNTRNGVVCAEFDRRDIEMNKLVVTTLTSQFQLFDLRTKHPSEGFSEMRQAAHDSTVWLGRHLPQNRDLFCTCGGNGTVNLWKYSYPMQRKIKHSDGKDIGVLGELELLNEKKMAEQPIVSWDWSQDKAGLAVFAALDQKVRVAIVTKFS